MPFFLFIIGRSMKWFTHKAVAVAGALAAGAHPAALFAVMIGSVLRYGGYGNGAGRQESMEAHPPSDVALVRLVPCHHYTGLSYPDTADRA